MTDQLLFTLDGKVVSARPGETIWQVAKREGLDIPHLCWLPQPGYRADGNCRACMVEVEGERVLTASCIRKPTPNMVVKTATDRAVKARRMVMELLLADQPSHEDSPDRIAPFWHWAEAQKVTHSRFPANREIKPDLSHPAMAVNLDACIECGLCVRACREVQVNDVMGMAFRGFDAKPVFDFDDPMGMSTCVACGECVQACPTGALYEKSLMDRENKTRAIQSFDKVVDSVCPFCGVGCQTKVAVKDNKIVQVDGRDGYANENRLCVKGRFGFDYVMSPERLTKPLIRRDDAPKAGDIDMRGVDPLTIFREATWEEALERAAGGLKSLLDAHGGKALAGFGSAKGSNEEAYLFQKLVRQGFGTNNVDHCTRLCHASSVAALMEGVGSGAVSAPFNDAMKAECIVVIGARPNVNHPVAATYFKQAAKKDAKLIVMDPRGQALKRHATHMLQFKPGADVAMLNAMLNVIIGEELYDRQYVQANTEGFEELQKKIKDFSPEKMEAVCGIPAKTLREVARTYAKSRASIIFWGMGISQHVHGTDNARCLIALTLMTGQVGRPGTGLHPLRGQNNVQGASDSGLIPMMYPDYQRVATPEAKERFEKFWGATLDPKPGLTVVEIMNAAYDGKIRGMYIMGENPAMSDPDVHHAREALAKLDWLVVQEIFLTETCYHADVILPATAWPEKVGTVTNTDRMVQLGRKALDAPGEAKPDLWIIQEIARRIGLAWNYQHASDVWSEIRKAVPSCAGITWERLERESSVTYPCLHEGDPGDEVIFIDACRNRYEALLDEIDVLHRQPPMMQDLTGANLHLLGSPLQHRKLVLRHCAK